MPARFCRAIHQQAQVPSFESFYSNPEETSSPWCIDQTVAGECSRYPTL